jgi:hypothetical protein
MSDGPTPSPTPAPQASPAPSSTPAPQPSPTPGGTIQGWTVTFNGQQFDVTSDEAALAQIGRLADLVTEFGNLGKTNQQTFIDNDRTPIISTLADWVSGTSMPDISAWDQAVGAAQAAKNTAAVADMVQNLNNANALLSSAQDGWTNYLKATMGGAAEVGQAAGTVLKFDIAVAATALTAGAGGLAASAGAGALSGAATGGLDSAIDQYSAVSTGDQSQIDWGKAGRDAIKGALVGAFSGAISGALEGAVTGKLLAFFKGPGSAAALEKVNAAATAAGLEELDGATLLPWLEQNITVVLRAIPGDLAGSIVDKVLDSVQTWSVDALTENLPGTVWDMAQDVIADVIVHNAH